MVQTPPPQSHQASQLHATEVPRVHSRRVRLGERQGPRLQVSSPLALLLIELDRHQRHDPRLPPPFCGDPPPISPRVPVAQSSAPVCACSRFSDSPTRPLWDPSMTLFLVIQPHARMTVQPQWLPGQRNSISADFNWNGLNPHAVDPSPSFPDLLPRIGDDHSRAVHRDRGSGRQRHVAPVSLHVLEPPPRIAESGLRSLWCGRSTSMPARHATHISEWAMCLAPSRGRPSRRPARPTLGARRASADRQHPDTVNRPRSHWTMAYSRNRDAMRQAVLTERPPHDGVER